MRYIKTFMQIFLTFLLGCLNVYAEEESPAYEIFIRIKNAPSPSTVIGIKCKTTATFQWGQDFFLSNNYSEVTTVLTGNGGNCSFGFDTNGDNDHKIGRNSYELSCYNPGKSAAILIDVPLVPKLSLGT